jgi:hypothetical protein
MELAEGLEARGWDLGTFEEVTMDPSARRLVSTTPLLAGESHQWRLNAVATVLGVVRCQHPDREFLWPSYGIAEDASTRKMSRKQPGRGRSTRSRCLRWCQSTRLTARRFAWLARSFPAGRNAHREYWEEIQKKALTNCSTSFAWIRQVRVAC